MDYAEYTIYDDLTPEGDLFITTTQRDSLKRSVQEYNRSIANYTDISSMGSALNTAIAEVEVYHHALRLLSIIDTIREGPRNLSFYYESANSALSIAREGITSHLKKAANFSTLENTLSHQQDQMLNN